MGGKEPRKGFNIQPLPELPPRQADLQKTRQTDQSGQTGKRTVTTLEDTRGSAMLAKKKIR
jgi:hypothetical protein